MFAKSNGVIRSNTVIANTIKSKSLNIEDTSALQAVNVNGTLSAGASTLASASVSGTLSAGASTLASASVSGTLSAGASTLASATLNGNLLLRGDWDGPGLAFQGNTGSGLYNPGLNEIGFATNNLQRLRIGDTFAQHLNSELRIAHTNAVADPKLTLIGNRIAGNQVCETTISQKSTSNTDKALVIQNKTTDLSSTDVSYRWLSGSGATEHQISNRLQHLGVWGSVSVPTYTFQSAGNSGMYYDSSRIKLGLSGTERMSLSTTGTHIGASGSAIHTMRYGQHDTGTLSIAAGGNIASLGQWTFGHTFTTIPHVQITIQRLPGSWLDHLNVMIESIQTTGFYISIVNHGGGTTTGNIRIFWTAIGN